MSAKKKAFKKLPTDICPFHYEICLKPDLNKFICEGEENIHVDINTSTNVVTLNSADLEFQSINFHTHEDLLISSKNISINNEEETVTIEFDEKLPPGRSGYIRLIFQGKINDNMKGLYRSKYTGLDVVGDSSYSKYAAVTQFESSDARRCFPCWDEPAYKCTFDVILQEVPVGLVALSNMPIKTITRNSSLENNKIVFETTPKMSTYLVAFVIGEFDYLEDVTSDGVLIRVYTPIGKKKQGQFALQVATKVLPYYHNYFEISYPLPKMDLIAIADFSSGAMENWGLVTYRETCLLVDSQNTSTVRKQWIALTVGHELAHQWFGNLVTMEWWDDLWLNEGYASFVEFLCVAYLFPEYDIWTQFVTDVHIQALELDALRNSHPIQVPVGHPSEIDEIFDDISYCKGASVIRMLHSYIGDEDFRKGMKLYLTRYSYANAKTDDLWTALEEVAKKPVRSVMSTWTKQQGFPLVQVEQRRQQQQQQSGGGAENDESNNVLLTFQQKRFLPDVVNNLVETKCKEKWIIPLRISVAQNPEKILFDDLLLSKEEETLEIVIKDVPKDSWIKINSGTIGFYRTMYSTDMLQLFEPAIKNRTLLPLDRLGLLDDLFAIAQAGHSSTIDVLKLMQAFQFEDDYTVWCTILNCLNKIGQLISHLNHLDNAFKVFGCSLLRNIGEKLGWEAKSNESHLDTLLRPRILGKLVFLEDEEIIREAKRRFTLHIKNETILAADLRSLVYRAVLSSTSVDDVENFETMLRLYRECDLHEEKDRILSSLGAVGDVKLLARVLQFSMSDQVRAQDSVFGITSVAMMRYQGRLLAWEFLKEKWDILLDRYKSGFLLTRLVKCITENFVTNEKAQEIEEFFKNQSIVERTVQQSVETIRLNVAWLNRDKDKIQEFLLKP
ncbi:puromycin-sensitive aminopeptidase-like [Leptopilina heterotoma]|uniref:puromycin-sensitive aminopeptidase-like n=1 Tax=Leptopilina heterotoma TaxID=63436 RepID=UPI001CAA36D6|nr:puromycin-sensitive aminopeptidase-like [Leptopilina heterotoma]